MSGVGLTQAICRYPSTAGVPLVMLPPARQPYSAPRTTAEDGPRAGPAVGNDPCSKVCQRLDIGNIPWGDGNGEMTRIEEMGGDGDWEMT